MKTVFMGSAEFGIPALEMLLSHHEVAAVVSTPARPRGRGLKRIDSPIAEFAKSSGKLVLTPENLLDGEFIQKLKSMEPDLFVVVAFRILPEEVYSIPTFGTVNIHASLLPRFRGAAPIHRAVEAGERETGVTVFRIDEGIDTGEIIAQANAPVGELETTPQLYERLSRIGADTLQKAMDDLANGRSAPFAQDSSAATRAPKLKRAEGHVDWNLPAQNIFNKIRAFKPFPGTYAFLDGKRIGIEWGVVYKNEEGSREGCPCCDTGRKPESQPGTIISAQGDHIDVQCGEGVLRILKVKPEGRSAMDVRAFLLGTAIPSGTLLK
ncbi:MAG: methionyl-tRNA formyltransferase [Chitinispirillales bacterium]|jgi:methionyl-tRNA formyltransferase|nr:methionyl-tRNA formyltransferase [Chitinispirillales bacterium]